MKIPNNRKNCSPVNYSEFEINENRLKIVKSKSNSSENSMKIIKPYRECNSRKEMRDRIIKKLKKLLSEIR